VSNVGHYMCVRVCAWLVCVLHSVCVWYSEIECSRVCSVCVVCVLCIVDVVGVFNRMPAGMRLNQLYSQCHEHCGPQYEYMCAIVSLCNSHLIVSRKEDVDPQMTPVLAFKKWQEHKHKEGEDLEFRGMAPEELCELAHLCGRRAKLVRHEKASSLVAGDLVYLLGTGLLNSQLSEEDHFEQPSVDSHVVVVYATSKCGVTFVNPDRRKHGKRDFHLFVNGFFTLTHEQLAKIWKVRRSNGDAYTCAAVSVSQTMVVLGHKVLYAPPAGRKSGEWTWADRLDRHGNDTCPRGHRNDDCMKDGCWSRRGDRWDKTSTSMYLNYFRRPRDMIMLRPGYKLLHELRCPVLGLAHTGVLCANAIVVPADSADTGSGSTFAEQLRVEQGYTHCPICDGHAFESCGGTAASTCLK